MKALLKLEIAMSCKAPWLKKPKMKKSVNLEVEYSQAYLTVNLTVYNIWGKFQVVLYTRILWAWNMTVFVLMIKAGNHKQQCITMARFEISCPKTLAKNHTTEPKIFALISSILNISKTLHFYELKKQRLIEKERKISYC